MELEDDLLATVISSCDEAEKERTDTGQLKKTKQKAKWKRKRMLTINLTNCKYESVRRVSKRFGLKPVDDDEDWTIFWTDTSVLLERVMDMKRYQKINHFPGMIEICRKDSLARNMNRMLKLFPKEYNIFPRSWCMPADFGDFQAFCRSKKNATFISKPDSGCQGRGIFVFKHPREIKAGEHCVVQNYLAKPFVIDGFKFDLRIYVLVTSCDPLRVYVYRDGLGRFATVQYHEPSSNNVNEQCMHLTNYAINKTSKDFIRDDDVGSKRRLTTVNQWFVDNGYNIDKIWGDIEDVIIKTLIAAHPILKHNYRSCFPNHNKGSACFEILGFDVLLDKKLKPWLIEVNHSPSFHTDAPLDKEVKEGLLYDTLNLIDLYANDKRKCIEEDKKRVKERLLFRQKSKEMSQTADEEVRAKYEIHLETYEKSHLGGFRKIYPNKNEEKYSKFFDQSTSLCSETAASKARSELAKIQREDIEAKQKELEKYQKKTTGSKPSNVKIDDMRPESPTCEKKSKPLTIKRRGSGFQIPAHTVKKAGADDSEQQETVTSIVPYGKGVVPEPIRDDEELERLAAMQLRDSLVRGLGVSEHLHASLKDESTQRITTPSSVLRSTSFNRSAQSNFFSHIFHPTHGDIIQTGSFSTHQHPYSSTLDKVQPFLTGGASLPSNTKTSPGTLPTNPRITHFKKRHHMHNSSHSLNSLCYKSPPVADEYRSAQEFHASTSTQLRTKWIHQEPHHQNAVTTKSQPLALSVISAPIQLSIRNKSMHYREQWNHSDSLHMKNRSASKKMTF